MGRTKNDFIRIRQEEMSEGKHDVAQHLHETEKLYEQFKIKSNEKGHIHKDIK
tara:strand:- start:715 stop:873 length:159 start_codon:yes stop_codon:yes gene_type:complete